MRRKPELIRMLLLKLEDYPSRLGDVFIFNGAEPELAIDGYSSEEIAYHLDQLKEMGLIDSPGSQPMIGVTFAGLSARGHDFLAGEREQQASAVKRGELVEPPVKPGELVTLKPTLWGFSVDLKELWRRIRCWWKCRWEKRQ